MLLLAAEAVISVSKFWTTAFSGFLNIHARQEIAALRSRGTEISLLLHAGGKVVLQDIPSSLSHVQMEFLLMNNATTDFPKIHLILLLAPLTQQLIRSLAELLISSCCSPNISPSPRARERRALRVWGRAAINSLCSMCAYKKLR